MSTPICPHCGYNLERDTPIERDGWFLSPSIARLHGEDFGLSSQQSNILYTLARVGERWMHGDALGNRISDSADYARDIAAVQICRMRKRLGEITPIETRRGRGYRWRPAA